MNDIDAPLIDSNILIYAYAEDSMKKAKAAELLEKCFLGKLKLSISLQNIGEFCSIATRKYQIQSTAINKIVQAILKSKNFVKLSYQPTTFKGALTIMEKNKLQFWDALLAATMLENDAVKIYTEDADFNKVSGIKQINPF